MKNMKTRSWIWMLAVISTMVAGPVQADDKKPAKTDKKYDSKLEKVDVTPKEWLSTTATKLNPTDIDAMLKKLQSQESLKLSARTTDEQFIRRVYLDLVGKLPEPADIKQFRSDKSTSKRSELINRLLASEDFNKHWAGYWRDVVATRATEQRSRINEPKFEAWLIESIRKNEPWSKMVTEMITANGEIRYAGGESKKSDSEVGAGHFLLTHLGADANVERAADTARVFMGIQIQCAQCHDHPTDIWKREQFHELTAFYARTKDRPVREENRVVGFTIFSALVGEHRMPDKDDPKKTYVMQPKFLTGEKPGRDMSDEGRRRQLAKFVTAGDNYWFHANMVNRVWADLMGQSFYNPVDNMGPLMEATYPEVLLKLAQHFKATGTDVRDLYRLIMNSETYQRQVRLGETSDQHLHFSGNYPSKLTADELWNSLNAVLGNLQQPFGMQRPGMDKLKGQPKAVSPAERLARRFGFEGLFKGVFAYDPTAKQDEIESTISQALLLMNNPQLQNRLRYSSETTLGKILKSHSTDKDAVHALYLRVLARTPTPREEKINVDYIQNFRPTPAMLPTKTYSGYLSIPLSFKRNAKLRTLSTMNSGRSAMLTHNLNLHLNREGYITHRRDFIKHVGLGAAAFGGLSWMDQVRVSAGELRKKGMSCILLFMRGGPSQFETFDPKPGTTNGGPTEAIKTAVDGIQIAKGWERTASLMKELAIIRSMTSKEGNHPRAVYQMHTSYAPSGSIKYPSLGSMVASEIADPTFDLPHYVNIGGGGGADVAGMGAGFLGMSFAPFAVQDPNRLPQNVELPTGVDGKRLTRRLGLMDALSKDFANAGGKARVEDQKAIYQSASSMVLSPRLSSFDLNKEKDAVRERYGKTPFGQGCLMARRLVETGVTFVEVGHGNWDTHDDNFNRTARLSAEVDRGMSALIADLKERGLLEKTLVIWMGEFGRTPNINARTGRDHYPRAFNMLMAGGGVKGGQVIGATSNDGRDVKDRPVSVNDLFCSFYHALKINPKKENMSGVGRPIKIVDGGTAVKELFA